jgi:hypothetical protein
MVFFNWTSINAFEPANVLCLWWTSFFIMDDKYIYIELENSKSLNTFVLVSFFSIGINWMKKCCKIETTYTLQCLGHYSYPWWNELQAILVPFLVLCKSFFCLLLWRCCQCCFVWISSMSFVVSQFCCYSWVLWNAIVLECCWNAPIF